MSAFGIAIVILLVVVGIPLIVASVQREDEWNQERYEREFHELHEREHIDKVTEYE